MLKCVFCMCWRITTLHLLCLQIILQISLSGVHGNRLQDRSENAQSEETFSSRQNAGNGDVGNQNERIQQKNADFSEQEPDYGPVVGNDLSNKIKAAEIQFFDDDEDSWEPQNFNQYFRMPEEHNELTESREWNTNVSRNIPSEKVLDIAQSRIQKFQLHSQEGLTISNKSRSQHQIKMSEKSIYAGGVLEKDTNPQGKEIDHARKKQIPLSKRNEKKYADKIKSRINYEISNEDEYNMKKYNYGKPNQDRFGTKNYILHQKLYSDKNKNKNYRHYSDVTMSRNKKRFEKQNRVKTQVSFHNGKDGYSKMKEKGMYKKDEGGNIKNKKLANKGEHYVKTVMQHHGSDRYYKSTTSIRQSEENYGYFELSSKRNRDEDHTKKEPIYGQEEYGKSTKSIGQSEENYGYFELSTKRNRDEGHTKKEFVYGQEGYGKSTTSIRQSEENYGYFELSTKRNRDESHTKKELVYGREGYGQSQKERKGNRIQQERGHTKKKPEYTREEPKHDKYNKVTKRLIHKPPLRVNHKKHGKKDPSGLHVTKGYHMIQKEVVHNEQQTENYESIEIESTKENLDSHENYKTTIVTHGAAHSNAEPLRSRTELSIETEVFKPYNIRQQLDRLRKKLEVYASIEQVVIGRTIEYNEIVLWKMKEKYEDSEKYNFRASKKKKYADDPPEKKIVFIVHGLSVMGWHNLDCLSKIKRFKTLLGYYMENLDCFDIYLIPMANPDGVAKGFVTQPWNKNVSPQNACPGVNLDRNFDVAWNKTHSKRSSCRQSYPGPEPFSESETKAIREVFLEYGHKIVTYLHVHAGSYDSSVFKGDAVLYPKGYTDDTSDDDRYIDLKGDIDEAMRNSSFRVVSVTVDTLYNWYNMTSGSSVDYASTVFGVPYAMELVMQLYEDDKLICDEDNREQNSALTEIWQVIIDVMFDSIYKRTIKPNED